MDGRTTVRLELRNAIRDEMLRDPSVFLIGEEVARYNGAYKVSQGLLDEFGEGRVIDTPITELGFAGLGFDDVLRGSLLGKRLPLGKRLLLGDNHPGFAIDIL
jgi:pyruvate dehydrogenase E1 component beta subunit